MKQEEKELLLKDLSSRLPYRVKILHNGWDFDKDCDYNTIETLIGIDDRFIYTLWRGKKDKHSIVEPLSITNYKPFLRSMSLMTEEERKEYKGFIVHREHVNAQGQEWDIDCFCFGSVSRLIDWLNAHHFDYRELIEKGLAIEVTEVNNPYKD